MMAIEVPISIKLKGHDGMNDYFLTILIRQRHEEILAEAMAAQLSQLRRFSVILVNRLLRRFHSFNSHVRAHGSKNGRGG